MRAVWFDRVVCGLFTVLAFTAMCLPELCVVSAADGSEFVFVGVIVDPPTGEPMTSELYSPMPLVLLFVVSALYYWLRATRPNPRRTFHLMAVRQEPSNPQGVCGLAIDAFPQRPYYLECDAQKQVRLP